MICDICTSVSFLSHILGAPILFPPTDYFSMDYFTLQKENPFKIESLKTKLI